MPLKILVNRTDEPASQPHSVVIEKERIIIGRDSTNDLPLDDHETKSVISRRHAEIVTHNTTVHLTDLGSKNFTFLNGERLEARTPVEVRPGDAIQIGDFEITFELLEATLEVSSPDETILPPDYANPFEGGAQLLAVALRSLRKHYDEEPVSRRAAALAEALRTALEGDEAHEASEMIGYLLAPDAAAPASATEPDTPAPFSSHAQEAPERPVPETAAPAGPAPEASSSSDARIHRLADTLLGAVAQLVAMPWRFRNEFIGQTIYQSKETAFLYEGDAEALKQNLLDPRLSDEAVSERLCLLEEALDEVEMHHLAMLEGYKAGVREGARRLIDQLNPEALAEEVAKEKLLYRLVSVLARAEALDRLRDQLRDLRTEDWAAAEQRSYRPAFIKAYLARMTAARRRRSFSDEP